MTNQELQQKVINATTAVEKRKAVLEKHRAQLAKMIAKGADHFSISCKQSDIESAIGKLKDAQRLLQNWKDKVGESISGDAFIEANAPQVIKDFLEKWKAHAFEYYIARLNELGEYRKQVRAEERAARLEALATLPDLERAREIYKDRTPTDYDLANLWPRKSVDEFLETKGLEYHQIREKIRAHGDEITFRLEEIRDEQERITWLNNLLENEKKAKLYDLITRINKVVGTITDASFLRIGPKGDINGYVVGTEGRAKVETIGAGGYNIVCFHFRTLIHEYK